MSARIDGGIGAVADQVDRSVGEEELRAGSMCRPPVVTKGDPGRVAQDIEALAAHAPGAAGEVGLVPVLGAGHVVGRVHRLLTHEDGVG